MLKGGERDFRGGLCGGLLVPLRSRETRSVRRTEAGCVGLAGRAQWERTFGTRRARSDLRGPWPLVDGSPLGDNLEVGRLGLIRCQRLSVVWDP